MLSKERFLNLTINMQLLYFITTVTSQSSFSQAPSACGVQCSTERLVPCVLLSQRDKVLGGAGELREAGVFEKGEASTSHPPY